MNMDKKRILIIGAGLAGTSLAHEFLEDGHHVQLIDRGTNHSTAVAAGMVNPMVFRRMNKSWRLDEFMSDAKLFYKDLESKLKTSFMHPMTIRRMIASQQERNYWLKRANLEEYKAYLEDINEEDDSYALATNQFGSGRVKNAFWIDAHAYYEKNIQYFKQLGVLKIEDFDPSHFDPLERTYRHERYDFVVFCLGYEQLNFSVFGELPIQPTKGQTLFIHSKEIPENESLNRKCFVLPVGDKKFRIGATYEWENTQLNPTEEGKLILEGHLSALGNYQHEILGQQVGIRPTVKDRRPILGEHQKFPYIYVFNGLGTKGYLMAPTLARELKNNMLQNKELLQELNVIRFNNLDETDGIKPRK